MKLASTILILALTSVSAYAQQQPDVNQTALQIGIAVNNMALTIEKQQQMIADLKHQLEVKQTPNAPLDPSPRK